MRRGGDDMGVFSKISNEMLSNAFVVKFQLWRGRYRNKLEAFIMCCVSIFLQICYTFQSDSGAMLSEFNFNNTLHVMEISFQ